MTGVDFVFRSQPTIYLLWALGDEETRRVIEAAPERAIVRVLEWIEDEVAVIRYGKDGIHRVRPPGGLAAARFRHYEARSGRPLLHDHLLLSVKGQRLDGKWGSVHALALHENTVAASALYNELVASEVCEELGLATEPRIVTPGRRQWDGRTGTRRPGLIRRRERGPGPGPQTVPPRRPVPRPCAAAPAVPAVPRGTWRGTASVSTSARCRPAAQRRRTARRPDLLGPAGPEVAEE